MSPQDKKNTNSKLNSFKYSLFWTTTVIAIVMAVVLITVGRISVNQATTITTTPAKTPVVGTLSPLPTTPIATINSTPIKKTVIPITLNSTLDPMTSKGNTDSKVTIIEYSDFQCSHCQLYALTVERELETAYVDTGKVRVIYRFMAVFDEESLLADEAAACAGEQGQFWAYYYLLMGQRASPEAKDLTTEKLQELAQQLGLDMNQFNESLLSKKYEAQIEQEDAEGRAMGINSTPSFIINGTLQAGANSLQVLQDIIDPILGK